MANRYMKRLYKEERIVRQGSRLQYVTSPDGTLFSGSYRTKIRPEDLPEWYISGRYYDCFGYMSAKGITDMVYVPNKQFNNFLKYDDLLVAYGGKITSTDATSFPFVPDWYIGYDEYISGLEIVTFLRGARKYSNYDIRPFIEQINERKEWLANTHPEEFDPHLRNFDLDAAFAREAWFDLFLF